MKLATLSTLSSSTAEPAAQTATLQQQLPQLVHSIEQLQRHIPQPLSQQDLQSAIRPLLVEQYSALTKETARQLKMQQSRTQAQIEQQAETISTLQLFLYIASGTSATTLLSLIYLLTGHH